jgi:nucleotide-binding universal stress UspA family protein
MSKHKVLIPLDGSATSQQMLAVIGRFFPPTAVELTLLHVLSPHLNPGADAAVSERERFLSAAPRGPVPDSRAAWAADQQRAWEDLDTAAVPLRRAGYVVAIDVRAGSPVEEIVRYVPEQQIDLIAMATHGRHGLRKLLLGSVAEEVLRCASVPLLVVRPTR